MGRVDLPGTFFQTFNALGIEGSLCGIVESIQRNEHPEGGAVLSVVWDSKVKDRLPPINIFYPNPEAAEADFSMWQRLPDTMRNVLVRQQHAQMGGSTPSPEQM